MSKHTRMSGGIGLAAFVAVALALTGCEEFEEPRTGAPHVIGVMIGDLNINEAVPLPNPGECLPSSGEAPYPEPDPARMPAGVCGGPISICPVACYPPRVGPAFAPLFAGGLAFAEVT